MAGVTSGHSALTLLTALLARRALVLGVPITAALLAALLSMLRGPVYSAESRFTPQTRDNYVERFSGLAAQLGITMPSGKPSESIDFYASLLNSTQLLREAALTRFTLPGGVRSTLVEVYRRRGASEEQRLRKTVDRLRRRIAVSVEPKAGIVVVRVSAPTQLLAEQLNRRVLDLVNDFNLKKRLSAATTERRFIESRLQQAAGELARAESQLEAFTDRNRRLQGSPQLRLQEARLARQLDLRQEVFRSLSQAYEQARIEEVRNTPVITVVDAPERSGRRVSRGVLLAGVLGALLGLVFAAGVVLFAEYLNWLAASRPVEYANFRAQVNELNPMRFPGLVRRSAVPAAPDSS
jgi:uncharacterized protein involved in exopolysaccharide biosynthesis